MKREDISTFDPQADFSIVERALPHWHQAGTVCFITWRLADSLPREARDRLDIEVETLLASENLAIDGWKEKLAQRGR